MNKIGNKLENKAVVAIVYKDGKVLSVSRKSDPNDFGLPGGKVEEGEGLLEALRRELAEEVGLEVLGIFPVSRRHIEETEVTYFAVSCKDYNAQTVEEGRIAWKTIEELSCHGTFHVQNKQVFEKMDWDLLNDLIY